MIEVRSLSKVYINDGVETPVLHGLTFEIKTGEFVAIMGPSGSGKSTLMHILAFLDRLTGGTYLFEGEDVSKLSDDELAYNRNAKVGFVFQAFNLLPKTTVYENVRLPLVYRGEYPADADEMVHGAIESVGLTHRIENVSNQLSGGEKQRVAIARALVADPAMIFADEPTGNLDSVSGGQVMDILTKLNDRGKAIILVTHEAHTAAHAKRVIRVRDGMIESDETVRERRNSGGGLIK